MDPEPFEMSEARIKFGNSSWKGFMKQHDWEGLVVLEPMLKFFQYRHLPPQLRIVSEDFAELAIKVVQSQERTAERTVCLRKLLEAKDAAVRNKL